MPSNFSIGNGFPVSYEDTDNFKIVEKKAKRNSMLAETDVYMIEDFPTTKKAEWVTYRKALRDMDFSDPNNITWPTKPE
tara:strand:+ start:1169 stop:1405 length:237 start_codon:yes stop_codon:yes gene_type:complete